MTQETLNHFENKETSSDTTPEKVPDQEISQEELSQIIDREEQRFKQETIDELGNLNSVNLDPETFEGIKDETGIEEKLNILDQEAEEVIFQSKNEVLDHQIELKNSKLFKEIYEQAEKIVISKENRDEQGNLLVHPGGPMSNLPEQEWKVARTTRFKEWFGEWDNPSKLKDASKVVDSNGEPMLVYHDTIADFNEFQKEYSNCFYFSLQSQNFPVPDKAQKLIDLALNAAFRFKFKNTIRKASFVVIKNPYISDKETLENQETVRSSYLGEKSDIIANLKAQGFDGIFGVLNERFDNGLFRKTNGIEIIQTEAKSQIAEIVAFEPDDILITRQDIGPAGNLHKK